MAYISNSITLLGIYAHFSVRWKPFFGPALKSWGKKEKKSLEKLIDQSKLTIQELNDQFISPSGEKKNNNSNP